MKHLFLILLGGLFSLTACQQEGQFASLKSEAPESTEVLASEPVTEYKNDIVSIIKEEAADPVIAQSKKRQDINLEDTVGENDLRQEEPVEELVEDPVAEVVEEVVEAPVEEVVEAPVAEVVEAPVAEVVEAPVEQPVEEVAEEEPVKEVVVRKEESAGKKVNLLIYLDDRRSRCVRGFNAYHRHFLRYLAPYNWDISFAFHSDEGDLMPLEYFNGRAYDEKRAFFSHRSDYILSKGEYVTRDEERFFYHTLKPTYKNRGSSPRTVTALGEPTEDRNLKEGYDSLAGLNTILSSHLRKGVKNIVLYFGNDFSYNTPKEWKSFYKKHSNTSIFAISERSGNVSNLLNTLKNDNFNYVPCGQEVAVMTKTVINGILDEMN